MQGDGPAIRTDSELRLEWSRDQLALRLEELAWAGSLAPVAVLTLLLALNALAAGLFLLAGLAAGDQALFFRELMPGTWISFTQLALVAYLAREVHLIGHPGERWHHSFWGLCAAVFAVFAVDEILQLSQFLGTWLNEDLGLTPAAGFNDVGAVLLTLLFGGAALLLLPRALVLLRHPLALSLLAAAALLGAASQGLDSFVAATRWEFVAEETLKLSAEAFFVGGFLVALRDALVDR